jgi:hypothetical protein
MTNMYGMVLTCTGDEESPKLKCVISGRPNSIILHLSGTPKLGIPLKFKGLLTFQNENLESEKLYCEFCIKST